MATLTVFTPAYNRAHTLPRTYESLLAQRCKDFVWLIVERLRRQHRRAGPRLAGKGQRI